MCRSCAILFRLLEIFRLSCGTGRNNHSQFLHGFSVRLLITFLPSRLSTPGIPEAQKHALIVLPPIITLNLVF